jgi:hypothetical protein
MADTKTADQVVVTLPSNSNMEKYPKNKPTEYTVTLRTALDFSKTHTDWEVALVYAQFTQGWNNVRKDCTLRFLVKIPKLPTEAAASAAGHQELFVRGEIPYNLEDTEWEDNLCVDYVDDLADAPESKFKPAEWVFYKVLVRASYFPSVQALLGHVSRLFDLAFSRYGASLDCEVDFTTGYAKLTPSRCNIMLMLGDTYFAELLGMPTSRVKARDYTGVGGDRGRPAVLYTVALQGTRKPKLDVLHSMYVYSDVIERQPVGDADAPLLGIVPVGDAAPGHRVHYPFNPLSYLPVSQSYIKNIQIQLSTEAGDPVPFASASDNVVCCLRFRRKPSGKYQQAFVL